MAHDASRLFHMSDSQFLSYFNATYPQPVPFKLVHLPPHVLSLTTSALLRKTCSAGYLKAELPPVTSIGKSGPTTQLLWASTPYSKPSKTKYPSFRSSSTAFDPASLQPAAIKFGLARLKSTYGLLHRRTSPWGPEPPSRSGRQYRYPYLQNS